MEKKKEICLIVGEKWKNLIKELSWMNRVQTGKHFLKVFSVGMF